MAEQSPPFSATPLERPSRSLVPTSSHRRSASVACTRVLWNLISSAKAVRLHHEQAQKLCRVVSEKPTSLRLPVLAADVETTARGLTSSAASSPTTSTTASSTAVAAHHTAQLEDAGSILCVNVTVPQNVPLPLDEEPDIADMDTTSTRKRSRPSESGSDDEGGSRKMHAVAPERATVACLTPTSNDAVAHEDAVTHATDEISQSEFQTVLSKSKKRRQRASTSQGPAAHTGPRPATESTAMLAHVAPGTSNAPTATQTAPAGVRATEHTMPASASSSLDSGTILFRPANASASFHRTSRLAIAQALSALPGVKEQWRGARRRWRLYRRSPPGRRVVRCAGDCSQATRDITSLAVRLSVPPTRVRLFRMVFEVRPSRPRPLQCRRCGRYGHIAVTCRGPERCLRCGGHHGKDANCTNKLRCLHCGRPHSADSADCQLWQRERRLATIKASAPTYLPHREAQAVLRASPSVTDSPQLRQTTGKSYAAAVGSPSKMTVSSTHPGQTGVQQRGPSAGLKHPDSTTTRPPAKVPSQPRVDQENANLRLLLRAVADLLPPENQLRSICLQAGGAHPHSSHHG
ncbi:hypothetical protein HPB51_029005 [Rhipicephalus microplus]|uniref:CCHC-type domain-containing protein n=1 Tax=Rhipicephalus microplus TaxID=6941 RepID=A0A9J6CVS2_RHIMP|nr:hypothetical protein HPB51_029005 [Rhipicephalus microplus]